MPRLNRAARAEAGPRSGGRTGTGRSRGALRAGGLVVLGYLVLGVLAGWVWETWWRPPPGVVTQNGWSLVGEGLTDQFSGTVLFVLVGAGVGLVATAVSTWWLWRHEQVLVAAVTLGAVAATVAMSLVGTALGPADPSVVAASAEPGTTVPGDLQVRGNSPYLVLPAVSLSVVALVLLLSTGSRNRGTAGETEQ